METTTFTRPRFGDEPLSLYVGRYRDASGKTAVRVVSAADDTEVYATISVNGPGVRSPEGEFAFKTYSENEGLLDQLRAAGVVEPTGRHVRVGSAGLQPVCRLRRPMN